MKYNFDKKVKNYFDVETAKLTSAIEEREHIDHVELTGLVSGMLTKGLSVILQEYHNELVKEIPEIAIKRIMKNIR
ncbi:hypothetical protein [Paenibacillus polymyxa]|uniref:hypothetical protein n=1 Tax=Paenibacillus polymyxa TaxID=1406 RepID=UPI002AB4A7B3|nr:hypothetical protein [Paenibacillus polymyxa]MDY8023367.1 hypothetical protein [Paenibacillus polymyxa]